MLRMWRRIKFLLQFKKSIPFLRDFFLSEEVDKSKKIISVAMVVGYTLIPFDVIPDFLVVFGLVDDLAVAGFIFQQMVKMAPESLKRKHDMSEIESL